MLFGFRTQLPVARAYLCLWVYDGLCSICVCVRAFIVRWTELLTSVAFLSRFAGRGRFKSPATALSFRHAHGLVFNLLSVACHLLSAVCHLPSAICHLPSAVCHLPSAVCGSWSIVGCSPISGYFFLCLLGIHVYVLLFFRPVTPKFICLVVCKGGWVAGVWNEVAPSCVCVRDIPHFIIFISIFLFIERHHDTSRIRHAFSLHGVRPLDIDGDPRKWKNINNGRGQNIASPRCELYRGSFTFFLLFLPPLLTRLLCTSTEAVQGSGKI